MDTPEDNTLEIAYLDQLGLVLVSEIVDGLMDKLWGEPGGMAVCILDERGLLLRFDATLGTLPIRIQLAQLTAKEAFQTGKDSGPGPGQRPPTDHFLELGGVTARYGGVALRTHAGKVIGTIGMSGLSNDGEQERLRIHRLLRSYLPEYFIPDEWPEFPALLAAAEAAEAAIRETTETARKDDW